MSQLKLYMVLLGGRPKGRLTEQHDIFFGIGKDLKELIPHIKLSWPEIKNTFHIDAWREVTFVNGYTITLIERSESKPGKKLFFLNLGGYKENEFDEFHYKVLSAALNTSDAIKQAKQTAFYAHVGFKGAPSHIDEKYGIDVDDVYAIEDILPAAFKEKYALQLTEAETAKEDKLHLGYLPLRKI